MEDYYREKEIREAISTGERALSSLQQAKQYMKSAGNWGLLDIFGGNMITGMMKHSKISKSRNYMEQARRDLYRFRKELDDVDTYLPDLEIGEFLTFADFFFDGLIADFMVQSKIKKTKQQLDDAIYQVENILNRLRFAIS